MEKRGERAHYAVVDGGGFVKGMFPHGEIGLGGAYESSARVAGTGVLFILNGSKYNTQEERMVHGLDSKEGIPADNIRHGSERLVR